MTEMHRGNLFIVAAPSGGGKTSLVKSLVESTPNIRVSISHTTRDIRPSEVNGVDYFFVNDLEFQRMIHEQAFIEHAHVFHHSYGTSAAQINDCLYAGIDVVLDIDWQGAQQIKSAYPESISIFIIPPSLDALHERLMKRQRDNSTVIKKRMEAARQELSHYDEFDYLIVNDEFEHAAKALQGIVLTQRLRTKHQRVQQRKLLSFLLSSA